MFLQAGNAPRSRDVWKLTLASIFASQSTILLTTDRVAALEAGIAEAKGGDEAAALKNLGTLLRRMHTEARIARELTQKTKEAAAKCQVPLGA